MKLVRVLTFNIVVGGVDERILNGVYPFSGFHCRAVLSLSVYVGVRL